MGLRETLNKKKSSSIGMAVLLILVAGGYLAYTQWPERIPKGDKAYYTVDDGQTWFVDDIHKVPPFDYNGKTALRALVFSYDNGHKTFCPIVERYNTGMKKQLDDAVAKAQRDGKPLSSIALFNSIGLAFEMDIKLAGPNHQWVSRGNLAEANKVFSAPEARAPDGSVLDLVIP